MRKSKRQTDMEREFCRGMLAALAVVKSYDDAVLFGEIVQTIGAENLIAACEGEEDYEWSGLRQYGYVK